MASLEYSQDTVIKKPTCKEVHKCNVCKYFTNSIFLIINHVMHMHHRLPHKTFNCEESAPEVFHCKDCDFKTDLTIFFKKHIQQVHLTRSENGGMPQSVEYALQSFICRSCTFETCSSLQWLTHQQVGCSSVGKTQHEDTDGQALPCRGSQGCVSQNCSTINSMDLRVHVTETHNESCFECYHCGYKTHSKRKLCIHIFKKHRPFEKWLCCDQCSFKTLKTYNLRCHEQNHLASDEIKWYQCIHCPFKTKYRSNLACHKNLKHKPYDQINWFKCEHCEFKSKLKHRVKNHVHVTHTDLNDTDLFHCEKCSFKTKTQRNIKKHNINKHLASEGIKPFQCDKCSYRTKVKHNLRNHNMNKHLTSEEIQWFQCDKCCVKLKRKSNLKTHIIRQHLADGEIQWFHCDNCSYKAKIKSDLNRHNTRKHLLASAEIVKV